MRSFATVLLGLLLSTTHRAAATPQPAPPVRPPHPAVDAAEKCEGCHERVTPAVHAAWSGSRHAGADVGCLACHGAPGADFKPRPAAAACASCHPDQAAGSPRELAVTVQTCLACHPAHALSPHRRPPPPR